MGEVRLLVVAGTQGQQLPAATEQDTTGEGVRTMHLAQPVGGLLLEREKGRTVPVRASEHSRLDLAVVLFVSG
ncbi:hypothetical protein ACH4MM_05020 [Streptomyces pratensis]|uniref:hypothetical protein n=1 Tax=Streptomyces pratensis TaxID=1169025 RepID=UPI00378B8156